MSIQWFDIDRKGLARVLERRGLAFVIFELIQNALDEKGVTKVDVTVEAGPRAGTSRIVVCDDSPEGFRRLSDAWTLFAASYKADNPTQRGRFNLGEKLVLALCDEANITTTKGTVRFDAVGRHELPKRTKRGTEFTAIMNMTDEQRKEALDAVALLIPPENLPVFVNGEQIIRPKAASRFHATLLTEYADENGVLRRTRRATDVDIFEAKSGEGWIYEMGIPVVETGDRWHYDIGQKVPQGIERDNVPPSFLTRLRTEALNALHDKVTPADVNEPWVRDAAASPDCTPAAFVAILDTRFGTDRVMVDPTDQEATKRAIAAGATPVYGNQLSQGERDKVRKLREEGNDPIIPAGKSKYATKAPFGGGDRDLKVIDPADYTKGQKRLVDYSLHVAKVLIGQKIDIKIVNESTTPVLACYRRSVSDLGDNAKNPLRALFGMTPLLIFNLGKLGKAWFEDNSVAGLEEINDLLIHELGHQYGSDHLADAFHDALCRLGAKLGGAMRSKAIDPGDFGFKS